MPERDGYIAGVPCWIDTSQPDPKAAVDFYGALFGWEFENVMPPDAPGEYFMARIRGLDVGAVGSIPEGAVFFVWEAGDNKGSQVVNEHGSNNFNVLNTRDLEGAKRFYGAVFGWETLDLGGDGRMWTLPGYGDHLEEKSPGLRKGMEEMGAPADFADVVASVTPIPADQPDTPPHWSLTFAVDEADDIASKAEELGGKVVMPPFDAPWVRMAVISDPQGATFVASKFVPENRDLQPAANGAGAA